MDRQLTDIRGGWLLGVAPPLPWRALLGQLGEVAGVPVLEVSDAVEAVEALRRSHPGAAVVFADASVRDYAVAGRIKAASPDLPVLVLLRGGGERAQLMAMEMGGDDVLRLPVTAPELVDRLRATMRRLREEEPPPDPPDAAPIRLGSLAIDVAAGRARRRDQVLPLTETEFQLLATLAGSAGLPLSRERLLNQLCGFEYEIDSRVIDVHVRNLRRKVEADPAHPTLIRTVPGVGYCVPVSSE